MLKTKEQLLYYLIGKTLKLSTYDEKFCKNLQHIITKSNRITSNQKDLFEKLISKYKKQITQSGLNVDECMRLSWITNIVESEPKYTGAQVSLDSKNQTIVVKVPFNRKFIARLREDISPNVNYLEWVRSEKYYVCPLCTPAIKFLVDELHKFFPTVTFDDKLQSLIDNALSYNARVYDPTLVKIHGNYYIAAINNALNEYIKDIKLNDDPKTLYTLSQYGITIHDDIIQDDMKKMFASRVIVNVDSNDLMKVLDWLHEFEVDKIYFGGRFALTSDVMYSLYQAIENNAYTKKINKLIKQMEKHLTKLNIKYGHSSSFFHNRDVPDKQPIVIQFMQGVHSDIYQPGKRVTKFIVVVDSSPIDIIEIMHEKS